ncbi:gluconate 2-dehydrogenase subunit 3 family protein [Gelidibacter gilvus]|uniref:Gluconate 2-dehydrogenase subunit 3 family protein n=1 Tax=Gelidibacter gilvus TaxID=59602 RepID=A0A4Q0XB78_9FLAO|nr:gluconate 2-dehydrogenase subunit 3 family protein [Gelidibacter gilvus]RXJ44368.1 gluconate 2-dehydrogenase subunit 3 family protein [Gelidibacter gilvus]
MDNKTHQNQPEVNALLNSEFLTEPTRKVLQERFEKVGTNRFFDDASFSLLSVVCDLLMDQDSENRMVNSAYAIDERLLHDKSDGWRYDSMPPDPVMYQLGLNGIKETASQLFDKKFIDLHKEQQIEILNAVQSGKVKDGIWKNLDSKIFFEELLAETAEIFFSHPTVQVSINYVGMADAKGWTKLKLNQSENLEN